MNQPPPDPAPPGSTSNANSGGVNMSGSSARDVNSTDNRNAIVTTNNYYGQTAPIPPKRNCPAPPPPPDHFAGREGDLATLKAILTGEGAGTVALTALKSWGGIGKTTLARQLAHEVWTSGEFGAVLWTEVKPKPTAARLLLDWAHYFDPAFSWGGLDEEGVARLVKAGLDDLINETAGPTSRVLVVLDDVWDKGIEQVRTLLKALPRRAVVLVTTRSAMVAQKLSARSVGLATLPTPEAVALLRQYLDDRELPQAGLEELATVLGGHALALTLAAKRLNLEEGRVTLALPRHLAEYKKGMASGGAIARLKVGDDDDSPTDREDSLGLVLSFSYAGLKGVQQERFRALGAFVYDQPFDLRLLAGLWAAPDPTAGDEEAPTADETARRWANELCNLSLIERASETELGDGWYRQHSLLHAYALASLKTDPTEYAAARDRYYDRSIVIARLFRELHDKPEEWGVLDLYLPHIHTTGDALADPPTEDKPTLPRALAFAYNITNYLFRRQEIHKPEWLDAGLQAARLLHERGRESLFLQELGLYYSRQADNAKALSYYKQSLPINKELNNLSGEASTLTGIGRAYFDFGNKRQALVYFEQALVLRRVVSDQNGEAITLNNIGKVYADLGDKGQALIYFEQALVLRRASGDRGGEAATLTNIGRIYDALNDRHQALNYYEQALPLRRIVGDQSGEAVTCFNIGWVYYKMGRLREAVEWVARCVELDEAVQHPHLAKARATLKRWRAKLAVQEETENKLT